MILFATHYLEEADAYADRVVLMARGEIVADGAPTSIKALVGSRTIRATLPGIDVSLLADLPGVAGVERHGDAIQLRCTDSDAVLRELLGRFPAVRDIEIQGAPNSSKPSSSSQSEPRPMSSMAYTRFELVRLLRNRRFFIFSLGFPLVLYVLIASPNRHVHNLGNSGISAPLYFMVGLVAFGTMTGVLGVGSRIAAERTLGWNRQLRLTPLAAGSLFPRQDRHGVPERRSDSRTPLRRRHGPGGTAARCRRGSR